MKVNLF